MGVTDHFNINTEQLNVAGDRLLDMSGRLGEASGRLKLLQGEDEIHGNKLADAVAKFHESWQQNRDDEKQNIQKLGNLSHDIAGKAENVDSLIEFGMEELSKRINELNTPGEK